MAKNYNVGPGQEYEEINALPLETLQAGDVVNIHWRETPYKEKFLVAAQGTKENPVVIRGVSSAKGQQPVISGDGAVAKQGYDTGKTNANKWLVKIGGPIDGGLQEEIFMARHIIIENLEIKDCAQEYRFTSWDGSLHNYDVFGGGIWLDRGEHITIRGCTIHNCSNGLFVNARDNADEGFFASSNIVVEHNHFFNNGVPDSIFEHNTYCAAIGILYQYNTYGPLKSGACGYGLKDRSSGTVIRYNKIVGGRRQISLDDGEDNPNIPLQKDYDNAYVYGNLLVAQDDGPIRVWGDDEMVHFGGDNPSVPHREGTMYFYNNTLVSYRPARVYTQNSINAAAYRIHHKTEWDTTGRVERTNMFYLSKGQHIDARNNIFYAAGKNPAPLVPFSDRGRVDFTSNWISDVYTEFMPNETNETAGEVKPPREINMLAGNLFGKNPGFKDVENQDFALDEKAECIAKGAEFDQAFEDFGLRVSEHFVSGGKTETAEQPLNIGAF